MPDVLTRSPADLTTVEIDGEVSVYNPETDSVVLLSVTASDVFVLCDGTLDEAGIADLLAGAYRGDADVIAAGVRDAVEQLLTAGLVARVPAPPGP